MRFCARISCCSLRAALVSAEGMVPISHYAYCEHCCVSHVSLTTCACSENDGHYVLFAGWNESGKWIFTQLNSLREYTLDPRTRIAYVLRMCLSERQSPSLHLLCSEFKQFLPEADPVIEFQITDVPQQTDVVNCGYFACEFARRIAQAGFSGIADNVRVLILLLIVCHSTDSMP